MQVLYARFTHDFLERREIDSFETEIYAKDWDPIAFRHELRSVKPDQIIGIGTATDPYQPAERHFNRTRAVLEALLAVRGISIYVTTKSDLVARDAEYFRQLARGNDVAITLTVTTMDRDLARLTEPFAPRPDLRIEAAAELSKAGVYVGVIANPVLPLITDSEENLEAVARAAKQAGARQFGANVLFLQPSTQRVFFPFIEEHFPDYLSRYKASFRSGAYLRGAYPKRIKQIVEAIRERVGIAARDMERMRPQQLPGTQMQLF